MYKIGQTYKVPCAVFNGEMTGKKYVVPIYDLPHNDRESGQYATHYHTDTRFISGKHLKSGLIPIRVHDNVQLKVYNRRYYRHNELKSTDNKFIKDNTLNWNNVKEMKCPHKGYDLSNLIPDCNNIVTCPLHGLKIKLKES